MGRLKDFVPDGGTVPVDFFGPMPRQIQLEAQQRGIQVTVSPWIEKAEAQGQLEGHLVRFMQRCWTERFDEGVEEVAVDWEEYASWWQHFKAACFPLWAKKRWPAKTVKHTARRRFAFVRRAAYPSLPLTSIGGPGAQRYAVINTILELPCVFDVELRFSESGSWENRLNWFVEEIARARQTAQEKTGGELRRVAMARETFMEATYAVKRGFGEWFRTDERGQQRSSGLGIETDAAPFEVLGIPLVEDNAVPPGVLRFVAA